MEQYADRQTINSKEEVGVGEEVPGPGRERECEPNMG